MIEDIKMLLNGVEISAYNLTPTNGTLNAIQAFGGYKKTVTNDNKAIDGTRIVTTPDKRYKDKRTVILPFVLQTASLYELERAKDQLEEVLKWGKDNTGINELYIPNLGKCYRLWLESIDKYTNFGACGICTLQIKFTEPNPANRSIPAYIKH